MHTKNLSIIAYLTIIGWGFSYLKFGKEKNNELLKYHLRQSLGVMTVSCLFGILIWIIAVFSPTVAILFSWMGILLFILLVLGIINALNETQRPVPIIGKFFENKFFFIS